MKGQRTCTPCIIEGLIPSSLYMFASVDRWEIRTFANFFTKVRFSRWLLQRALEKLKTTATGPLKDSMAMVSTVVLPSPTIYRHFLSLSREKS